MIVTSYGSTRGWANRKGQHSILSFHNTVFRDIASEIQTNMKTSTDNGRGESLSQPEESIHSSATSSWLLPEEKLLHLQALFALSRDQDKTQLSGKAKEVSLELEVSAKALQGLAEEARTWEEYRTKVEKERELTGKQEALALALSPEVLQVQQLRQTLTTPSAECLAVKDATEREKLSKQSPQRGIGMYYQLKPQSVDLTSCLLPHPQSSIPF